MDFQIIINIVLIVLVAVLSILLLLRHKNEKKRYADVKNIKLTEYSEFLMSNAQDGSIVEVAKRMSDMLVNALDCRYIVFLRKKKGALDLNYYHNIRNFHPKDFHLEYNVELDRVLKTDYMLRSTDMINKYLSPGFKKQITKFGIDRFFPIFWRDNLYGIYFIKSNNAVKSPLFSVLLASLAQSLSAAYHIKWHETRLEKNNAKHVTSVKSTTTENGETVEKILKLVRQRKSSKIIPGIVDALKELSGINGLVYYYESEEKGKSPVMVKSGLKNSPSLPKRKVFDQMTNYLKDKDIVDLNIISDKNDIELSSWASSLQKDGFSYVAYMPLTKKRNGLVAVAGISDIEQIKHQLTSFRSYNETLLENAESFEKIEELSYTDNLTQLSNQRYFIKRLDEEFKRAKRYNRLMALIIFDIDGLKIVNDRYGHLAGDDLISRVAGLLKKSIRTIDIISRYGGDEFCIIMPESDHETCLKFMSRIQSKLSEIDFMLDGLKEPIKISLSMGAALYPNHAEEAKDLIYKADMALLKAKQSGRNKFFISQVNN